jgi:hypothetical protein
MQHGVLLAAKFTPTPACASASVHSTYKYRVCCSATNIILVLATLRALAANISYSATASTLHNYTIAADKWYSSLHAYCSVLYKPPIQVGPVRAWVWALACVRIKTAQQQLSPYQLAS